MKKVLALLVCLAMVFSMAGCSLFTSGTGDDGKTGGSTEVKITDEFTHKDPEGLVYAKRYAYYAPDMSAMAQMFEAIYNATPTAEYVFIYADENDVALAEYTYYVMADEEGAKNFVTVTTQAGGTAEAVGNVTVQHNDKDAVATNIEMFKGMQVMDSSSAEAYAKARQEMDGLAEYNPQ